MDLLVFVRSAFSALNSLLILSKILYLKAIA